MFYRFIILFGFFLSQGIASSQLIWETKTEEIGENQFNLILTTKIPNGEIIYGNQEETPFIIVLEDPSILNGEVEFRGSKKSDNLAAYGKELTYFKRKLNVIVPVKLASNQKVSLDLSFFKGDKKGEQKGIASSHSALFDLKFEEEISTGPISGFEGIEFQETQSMDEGPIKWAVSSVDLGGGLVDVYFKADIESGWKLYSSSSPTFKGEQQLPGPFSIRLGPKAKGITLVGDIEELGDKIIKAEPLFEDAELHYYKGSAYFKQRVKVEGKVEDFTGLAFEFTTCDHVGCRAPHETYLMAPGTSESWSFSNNPFSMENVDCWTNKVTEEEMEAVTNEKGLWKIFLLGFLGGLIALLTPCVFPMIPLTVSYFTKSSTTRAKGIRNAFTYGFFIVLIYFLLSLPVLIWKLPPSILNEISTNVWLNLGFFVIFIVFAISFFGYFEIQLPSKWVNKADNASNVGGLIGIFFMALTLALVSFSCTGPILGSLLVGSLSGGSQYGLVMGMLGFGFALALPFGLFAAFPSWLNSLPKSGGWLNTVKVVLGFLELALALKFLSNADLVEHWGILKRELFLGLWVVIGIGLVLYLSGFIRFPHDGPVNRKKFGWFRWTTAALFLAFTIYLIPGLMGKNLRLISGFPPPMFYSWFANTPGADRAFFDVYHEGEMYVVDREGKEVTIKETGAPLADQALLPGILESWKEFKKCPLGLTCFHDIRQAIEYAEKKNKPIFVDFTGWACVNCRRMEENVWVEDEVYSRLRDSFIVVSLYVDDKKSLPMEKRYISCRSDNYVNTVGRYWADLQTTDFAESTQPQYVLLTPDGKNKLNMPVGYTPRMNKYVKFLDEGLGNFRKHKKGVEFEL